MTATKIRPVQATAPERIYLQGGPQLPPETEFGALSEVTWCRDDVDGVGIPYVRADLAGAAPAAVAGWGCEDRSAWYALAMGAAASLEDAANCLRDKDAQKAAMGSATHVRESCNKLWWSVPALEAPAAPAGDLALIIAALEHGQPQMAHYAEPCERHAKALAAARRMAAAPQAPAAPSAIATQVIENLLQLARIVNTAVEDWGESFEDGSSEVTFHKEEADKLEGILEFFDSLPDAPPEEDVIESGPLRAARVLRSLAAPAAPAVDAQGERDAAFEAVRNRLCSLQRYSFVLDDDGIVRRAHDRTGSWIEFDDAHALFDPVAVDAAIAAQAKEGGAPVADAAPLDVCTDPYNCARCKTHPAHRGDMHHAGISRIGGSA